MNEKTWPQLGDYEFEEFTRDLLLTMGVATDLECVGGSGDHGVDLRGQTQHRQLFIVQCKRYFAGKIAPSQTLSFRGAIQRQKAAEAWFVTTSFFTRQAKEEVSDLTYISHVVLVDGKLLIDYIQEHWDALPAEWQWRLTECMVARDQQRAE